VADIVLFGATGYTGRLTAEALARRGLDFAIAGRSAAKLEALASATGGPDVHLAEVGDVDALANALEGARVLVTCVGPFSSLGWTAAEAALRAGVHYVDSTGEGTFVHELIERHHEPARAAGIAMCPSMGFDEVPSDVAVSLAVEDMDEPDVIVTFAAPSSGSQGTIRSALGTLTSSGWRVEGGRLAETTTGQRDRWAPLPPPLGVRRSVNAPLSIGRIAPMHLDLHSLDVFMTTAEPQRVAVKVGLPLAKVALSTAAGRSLAETVIGRLPEGPGPKGRAKKWTVMAEARAGGTWRNVVVTGEDVYGLTGDLLASAAERLCAGTTGAGVLAPVAAMGLDWLQKELTDRGVSVDVYGVDAAGRGD
jgi:short subunit dehydrogenase-like uncharacterized protein